MYQKTALDNGLRVITATMPHTRSVCISIFIGVGSRYEAETEAGISHFIEHLCFKGTQRRPTAIEISETIEGVGGILNGGTGKELTNYWCKVTPPHFPLALDILVDMLLNSKFDPQDVEGERQIIIEEINMNRDSPSQQVNTLIDGLLWPGHPLGRDVSGSRESVAVISRDMMLDYRNGHYQPGNMVVAIAGNIRYQEALAAVSQALGSWAEGGRQLGHLPCEEQLTRPLLIENRDINQAHLCLALPGLSLFHPKRFTLDLLNVILGAGMSSRLFAEIREKLGLAYSIHSYTEHFLDSGSVVVYAGVEPKKLEIAIKAILEQLSKLKETIPDSELSKAKEFSKGRLLLQMENNHNVAGWVGGQEILTRHILSVDQMVSIIDAITADEIKQLAQELLVASQLRLAVVGPIPEDKPLEGLLKL